MTAVNDNTLKDELAEQITTCEDCLSPIRDGDKYHPGNGADLCENCAPTYQDMLDRPSAFFSNETGKHMTFHEAIRACNQHQAQGGKMEDKLVS